jgi:hypothetical protein
MLRACETVFLMPPIQRPAANGFDELWAFLKESDDHHDEELREHVQIRRP